MCGEMMYPSLLSAWTPNGSTVSSAYGGLIPQSTPKSVRVLQSEEREHSKGRDNKINRAEMEEISHLSDYCIHAAICT